MNARKNFDYLLPKTRSLLEELIETAPFLREFVFVGGSALALHLCHRKSEDLDFFTYAKGAMDKRQIRNYISRFDQKMIVNESDDQLDLIINGVKVTFFDAGWKFLCPASPQAFNLSTLEAIAAMKTNVLFLRAKYRDYYDLYFLVKQMGTRRIFQAAQGVVEGLTYKLFVVSLLYIDDIADDNIDHLEPTEKLTARQIQHFFEQRVKK